jgi:hypothetical protein
MVAVLAALQPAREAMGVPPREALDIDPAANIRPQLIRNMALGGIGLLALVYPIARLPSPPSVSLPGYLAALLLFVGFALLAPLLLRQFGRLQPRGCFAWAVSRPSWPPVISRKAGCRPPFPWAH